MSLPWKSAGGPGSLDAWWGAHQLVASLVPPGSRVLDIGCGWGVLAGLLSDQDCRVVGVEPDAARREAARSRCEQVLEGVAEGLGTLPLEPGSFDVLIFADVLEHLSDPWNTLRESLRYLRPGGQVVLSVPNVANYAVRANLLKGEFRYQDFGIYDRTHLRFFTRATLEEMLQGAGLEPRAWRFTPNLTEMHLFRRTLGRILTFRQPFRYLDRWLTYRFNRLFAVQFIVACGRAGEE